MNIPKCDNKKGATIVVCYYLLEAIAMQCTSTKLLNKIIKLYNKISKLG